MTPRVHSTKAYWGSNDTHQVDIERNHAPGPGINQRMTRWCIRCQVDRPRAGGRLINGMWFCADHAGRKA